MVIVGQSNSNTGGGVLFIHPSIYSFVLYYFTIFCYEIHTLSCPPLRPPVFFLQTLLFILNRHHQSITLTIWHHLNLWPFLTPGGRQPWGTPAAPGRGGVWRSSGASQPRTRDQDPQHPGAESHGGKAAAGAAPHAVRSRRPPSRTLLSRLQATAAAGQESQSRCCRRETWRRGDVPSCSVREDLPAYGLHRCSAVIFKARTSRFHL